jgi:CMP-2-keto-3-deoxyoctulosonic acid synthetase
MNRLLQHGYKIKLIYTNEKIQSVDVKADVKKVEYILNDNS